ncbi:MAG: 23S rRNA (pseudouridine(1915)-N(3))-methyltransferase RlmH [Candidatus Absconditabacterales bacterium]|nr:23S rRNA (pseudouridine(1915)-N(3))-methyltransferase RlmH [Candidatus Absconditabacterales bacterium]
MIHIHYFDTREKEYAPLIAEYTKRLRSVTLFSHQSGKGTIDQIRHHDSNHYAAVIKKKYQTDWYRVLLDERGKDCDSLGFAAMLSSQINCVFFLGGTYGLDSSLLAPLIEYRLRFGAMTMHHILIKLVLLEQIWRADCINHGREYHR